MSSASSPHDSRTSGTFITSFHSAGLNGYGLVSSSMRIIVGFARQLSRRARCSEEEQQRLDNARVPRQQRGGNSLRTYGGRTPPLLGYDTSTWRARIKL